MKTIGITKDILEDIRNCGNGDESANDIIIQLLENKDNMEDYVKPLNNRANVHIDDDVFEQLKELKQPTESFGSVITRLINSKK